MQIGFVGSSAWKNVYVAAVPYGQQITTANINDPYLDSNPSNFWYWADDYEVANFTKTVTPGHATPVTMCIYPTWLPAEDAPLKVNSQISGSIYALYSTTTTTNSLAQVGTFSTVVTS